MINGGRSSFDALRSILLASPQPLAPSPYLAGLRHPQATLADDVLLNLRGAAADNQPQGEHELVRPGTVVDDMRGLAAERSVGPHDLQGQCADVVVQLGADQFIDHRANAR